MTNDQKPSARLFAQLDRQYEDKSPYYLIGALKAHIEMIEADYPEVRARLARFCDYIEGGDVA